MDGGTFDRLTRLLAGTATRRRGLAAALGALPAVAGLGAERADARKGRDRHGHDAGPGKSGGGKHRPSVAGPCGSSGRDNRCKKDKECCTGHCQKSSGAKIGRCRCIKQGKGCKNGQTCCGNTSCIANVCSVPGPTCGATATACTSDANCCSGLICENGLCAPCVETVCASGCDFTDVNAAYAAATAGDTIYIGPGTYATAFLVTKDITLAACPGVSGVILQSARDANVQDTYGPDFAIIAEDTVDTATMRSVTVRNLAFDGTATGITNDDETFLSSAPEGLVAYTVENCTFTKGNYGIRTISNQHTVKDSTFDGFTNAGFYQGYPTSARVSTSDISGSTFTNQDSYGIYIYMDSYAVTTTVTDCSFPNNKGYSVRIEGSTTGISNRKLILNTTTFTDAQVSSPTSTYSYLRVIGATAEITGCTFTDGVDTAIVFEDGNGKITDTLIKDNKSESGSWGGGIYIRVNDDNCSLEIAGTTLITGNTATGTTGGGIYSYPYNGKTVTITGTTTTNVTGNFPDNCNLEGVGVVSCATWAP
jgi:hypothetical protein